MFYFNHHCNERTFLLSGYTVAILFLLYAFSDPALVLEAGSGTVCFVCFGTRHPSDRGEGTTNRISRGFAVFLVFYLTV